MLSAGEEGEDIGSVAAQVRFAERVDMINSAGIEVDELGIAYERLLGEPAAASEADVVDVFGASGGAGLFRRAKLDAVDEFDESFFAYLEDADLAWRARMQGWRSVYRPARSSCIIILQLSDTGRLRSTSSSGETVCGCWRRTPRGRNYCAEDWALWSMTLPMSRSWRVRHEPSHPLRGRLSGLGE